MSASRGVGGHLCGRAQLRGRGREARGNVEPEQPEQGHEVTRPADAHGRGAGRVFEHQVPPDDPGRELAHGGVRVRVGAPRHGHGARHLGVTQAGKRARDAHQNHRQGHRGTGVQRGHLSCDHEDARTDDGADAERDEIDGPEGPRQGVLTARLRLGAEDGDRLGGEQGHPAKWGKPVHAYSDVGWAGLQPGREGLRPRPSTPLLGA